MQIKTLLDEIRTQLHTSKNAHLRQIEMMESEELQAQKKVRCEMIQMADVLAQIRKEYETLRIDFEQNMAANEQTAPINREMRHLITSLQNHNGQLKGEVHRYKRKYKDTSTDHTKLRKDFDDMQARLNGVCEHHKKHDMKYECNSGAGRGLGGVGGSGDGGGISGRGGDCGNSGRGDGNSRGGDGNINYLYGGHGFKDDLSDGLNSIKEEIGGAVKSIQFFCIFNL